MDGHKKHPNHGQEVQDELKEEFGEAVDVFKDIQKTKKMNLGKEFKNALEIVKLNKDKMKTISINHKSTTPALLFILIGGLGLYLGLYLSLMKFEFLRPSLGHFVVQALVYVVLTIVLVFIIDVIANLLFKGKGTFGELFRVLGYGNIVMLAGIVSVLGSIAGIWYLVIVYKALEQIKKLSIANSIITIVLGLIVAGLISYLLTFIFGYGPMNLFDTGIVSF